MTRRLSFLLAAIGLTSSLASASAPVRETVERFCVDCHDAETKKGGLDLDSILGADIARHSETWEKVVRQISARQMPPIGKPRPDEAGYEQTTAALTATLDAHAAAHPQPGRTDTLRRLTRTEYQNAIRDLLALDIDATTLLPADESSHGFDNITVGDLPPALLQRYITAAQKISRMAVGAVSEKPGGETIRIRPDITQEDHVKGLPLGTRGGALIRHTFPRSGEYEVQVRLMRDRNEVIEGLSGEHEMEVLLNRERVASFAIKPPPGRQDFTKVDAQLRARFQVEAGPQDLGVTFPQNSASQLERLRQPYRASFNFHRHPRLSPAVYEVSITGPYGASGAGETPSRRQLFTVYPQSAAEEEACARQILGGVIRRAYRRPIADADLVGPLGFFGEARAGGFDAGIEAALSAILLSREFLFRTERDPVGLPAGTVYRISELELASRLSFLLWSSIPDDALLDVAVRGDLKDADALERQVRRMLADPRAQSLVTNFADQWLYLRNLDAITPDARLFPDFDDNLRQAFRTETSLLFADIVHRDRSVLELLHTGRAFLNERLAQHYGIPHIYGPRFREVPLAPETPRGGLLRQASILTVTSYATRTSPVIRGHWILKNLLGTPPPPPPPDVPALEDNTVAANLPVRERLAKHRDHATCASCHRVMDPVGLALENFDAIGRWRVREDDHPVDASGGLPDGSQLNGVAELERGLLARPGIFVRTLTEKLLTFALGRGIEPYDAPAVREVVRRAAQKDYRFSEVIVRIVASPPFQMRTTP